MDIITLPAQTRTITGRKNYQIRNEGNIPAVVYGLGIDPQNITINRNMFITAYRNGGESTLINLAIDKKEPVKVLIQAYQQHPVNDQITHADFRQIDMDKPITAEVKLVFVGESAAVKVLGGTLLKTRDSVQIKVLPKNLIGQIDVDLSVLSTFDDAIHVSDLIMPEGAVASDEAGLTIATVSAPRLEADIAQLDEAVEENVGDVEAEGEKAEEGADSAEDGEKKE